MKAEKSAGQLFHVEVRQGIYLISSDASGPTEDGRSLAPGAPTGNSYLVIGQDRALLFDLAVDDSRLAQYVMHLAGKPVQLVLSHGHYDHAYHLEQFEKAWVHPADEPFIREGMLGLPPVQPCPMLHPLSDGDAIELGGRALDVINIPGHTMGSILLLDRQTKTLLSGDTCTRRLLYGLTDYIPIQDFCNSLRALQQRDFEVVYSAHDRCALPASQPAHMIDLIKNELPSTHSVCTHPGLEHMALMVHGEPHLLDYFDMAIPFQNL